MAGYVFSKRSISVNPKIDWKIESGLASRPDTANRSLTEPESLLTYRSGEGYERAIREGATQLLGPPYDDYAHSTQGDKGHEFEHRKVSMFTTHPHLSARTPSWVFDGPAFFADQYARPLPYAPTGTDVIGFNPYDLNTMGATAISQCYPTKPQSDLLVAIAEVLREGLPSVLFSAVTSMKGNSGRALIQSLSSDYLNLLFGVSPLVREIDKLLKAVSKIDQIMAQLVRDSGNVVRRSRKIKNTSSLTQETGTRNGRPLAFTGDGMMDFNVFTGSLIPVTTYQTLEQSVWFAGAFQYWIPGIQNQGTDFQSVDPTDFQGMLDISQGIFGLRATPKAAWNLLPFSWLVDWFLNVGSLLENADAMDRYGLVLKYGYVMAESKLVTTTTWDFSNSSLSHLGSVINSTVAIRQQRTRATPYGFGLSVPDFNPVQLSILAALGLSFGRG